MRSATDPCRGRFRRHSLYPRWAQFLRPDDILVAETGTASMGLGFARMPRGASFHNQTLWGSIGWATSAAFGAADAPTGVYIEVVTDAYAASELAVKLHDSMKTLYRK